MASGKQRAPNSLGARRNTRCVLAGDAGGLEVYADRIFDVTAVPSSNRQGNRQPDLSAELQDECIASGQAFECHRQAAECIAFIRVRASEVHDQIRS